MLSPSRRVALEGGARFNGRDDDDDGGRRRRRRSQETSAHIISASIPTHPPNARSSSCPRKGRWPAGRRGRVFVVFFFFFTPPTLPKTCVRVLSCTWLVRDGLNSAVFWWMRLSAIPAPGGKADQSRSREVYHQPTHSSQRGEGVKIFSSSSPAARCGADVLCWMHLLLSLLLGSRCPNTMQI